MGKGESPEIIALSRLPAGTCAATWGGSALAASPTALKRRGSNIVAPPTGARQLDVLHYERMRGHRLVILLLEDDENDILFVKYAMQKGGVGHKVHAVPDG